MRTRTAVAWIVAALLLLGEAVLPVAQAAPASPALLAENLRKIRSVLVRPPLGLQPGQPVQVLLALHGMGGNGEDFVRDLAGDADRNHWLIVAPTIDYGDWRDPGQVADEDPALMGWLASYLDELPSLTGLSVRRRAFVLGFSRGAQLAHRFALFYPEKVTAVASVSAGTYTVPLARSDLGKPMMFPFGVGDLPSYVGRPLDRVELRNVQFWVAVGGDDTSPADLPRQWDAYIGDTRVRRAQAFQSALQKIGERSVLTLYRGTKHALTPEMRTGACTFFRGVSMAEGVVASGPFKANQAVPN